MAANEHAFAPEANAGEWTTRGDAAVHELIAQRRCRVHACMAEFIALANLPERRAQARRLLEILVPWVEDLYSIEDAVLGQGPQERARRVAHEAALRDLHTSLERLVAADGAGDGFDLVHAIDTLLIHEWVMARRADGCEPIALRQRPSAPAAVQEPVRPTRLAAQPPPH